MFDYLCKLFGDKNVIKYEYELFDLPMYMKIYSFEFIKLYNNKLIFMKSDGINIRSYSKHSKYIYEMTGMNTVLVLDKSKEIQRQNLIQNNLMFIEKNKCIFMPYVGLVFEKNKDKLSEEYTSLTYTDFIVSIAFIYLKNSTLKVNDLCNFTSINKMSVIRATRKLEYFNLIEKKTIDKSYSYKLIKSKKEYINEVIRLMKSPINTIRLIDKNKLPKSASLSSISALSKNTMISDDVVQTYAIQKDEYKKIKSITNEYMNGLIIPSNQVKLEVWNYNPRFCSINECAELVSVIKTIDEDDERVLQAVDEIKEKIINE